LKVQRHGGSVLKALYRSAICPFGKPPFHPVPAATAPAPAHSPRITRLQEEMRFKVLHALQQQPDMNQRQLADMLGVSLGKANYVLRALVEKGLLKARNFRNSQNKLAYAYLLTPSGIAQKAELTRGYLERKTAEFEALKGEIERLKAEVEQAT
jgi:EPS-associated MarR family transcriptional regulator